VHPSFRSLFPRGASRATSSPSARSNGSRSSTSSSRCAAPGPCSWTPRQPSVCCGPATGRGRTGSGGSRTRSGIIRAVGPPRPRCVASAATPAAWSWSRPSGCDPRRSGRWP